MRISLTSGATKITTVPRGGSIHMRVISGAALIGREQQDLIGTGGLPVSVGDGIVSLQWDAPQIWLRGDSTAEMELLLP